MSIARVLLSMLVILTGGGAVPSAGAFDGGPGALLEDLTRPAAYTVGRVSSYDSTGGNADFFAGIQPGETRVLADIDGPGMITHIWITTNAEEYYGRKIVLRMYWDGEESPSVLAPLNDFFCMGHGLDAEVNSLPIVTRAGGRAKNCYFKMPYNKRAKIEITNEGTEPIGSFYYYVNYRSYEKPFEEPLYFHAHYRQEYPPQKGHEYLVADIEGRGNYVGTVLSYESHSDGWWGEGDDRFYIDGETTPSLHGTGTEDYLNDAWGMWKGSSLFHGTPIHEAGATNYGANTRYSSYRFHIADPIPFRKSLRFDIEHYGAGLINGSWNGFVERFDDISSVAYWYQTKRTRPLEPLAPVDERLPRSAAAEKPVLKFKRLSRETQTAETFAELTAIFEQVTSAPELSSRDTALVLDYALALIAAGKPQEAGKLLDREMFPFLPELAMKQPALRELLTDRMKAEAPLLVQNDDGSMRRVKVDGTSAFSTDLRHRRPYLYMRMPDNSPLREKEADVVVRLTYFSDGETTGNFNIQYHSAGTDGRPGEVYGNAGPVSRAGERGWHTAEIRLPGARFTGAQNRGADFRIDVDGTGQDLVVREVEVRK